MINCFGVDGIIETVYTLSAKYFQKSPKTLVELKDGYLDFLRWYQPNLSIPAYQTSVFIDDEGHESNLVSLYKLDSLLNDRQQSQIIGDRVSDVRRIEMRIAAQKSMDIIQEKSSATFDILNLVIHAIFFHNSIKAGGGSTSNAVGVIWLNNKKDWSIGDLAELLIHELTHNLVFLDEIRYLHITDYKLLTQPENYALSAILKTKRPLDKVFHSIVVAAEVLMARDTFIGHQTNPRVHPPSDSLRYNAMNSLNSLYALPNIDSLLTSRGLEIMSRAKECLL